PAASSGIALAGCRDHAPHAGGEERLGARRRLAVMRARLEGDDDGRAARAVPRGLKCRDFRVIAPVLRVPAFPDDGPVLQYDGADEGIRRNAPPTPPREVEGAFHRLRFGDALRS